MNGAINPNLTRSLEKYRAAAKRAHIDVPYVDLFGGNLIYPVSTTAESTTIVGSVPTDTAPAEDPCPHIFAPGGLVLLLVTSFTLLVQFRL